MSAVPNLVHRRLQPCHLRLSRLVVNPPPAMVNKPVPASDVPALPHGPVGATVTPAPPGNNGEEEAVRPPHGITIEDSSADDGAANCPCESTTHRLRGGASDALRCSAGNREHTSSSRSNGKRAATTDSNCSTTCQFRPGNGFAAINSNNRIQN